MAEAPEYVKILRQKLGEFMLTMLDLHQRGIKLLCGLEDCIESLIDELAAEGKNKPDDHVGHPFNKISEHVTFYSNMKLRAYALNAEDYALLKQFVNLIITSKKYSSESEVRLLNVLLFNNGFPYTFSIKQKGQEEGMSYTEFDSLYKIKMYFILGDNSGNISSDTKNHYTIEIPDEFKERLLKDNIVQQAGYAIVDNKIQISPDGNCFYTAVGVWCKIYGIKEEHLKSITYNVPFEFSKEHFESNMKVRLSKKTDSNPFPKPISLPNSQDDLKKIAENMIEQVKKLAPNFGEFQNITGSKEYKDYKTKGVIKDNETHCNKYKGNLSITSAVASEPTQ